MGVPQQQISAAEIIANLVRERYDLGEIQLPENLPAAHQRRHRKMLVDTSKGRYLIKTYKRDPLVLDNLRFQHRLSEHLHASGLPVAEIITAIDGKRIVELDNWAFELQRFVPGQSMIVNSPTLEISAKALGRFHVVCRQFPRPERDGRMWRFSEVPRETFAKLYQRAKQESGSAEVDRQCNQIALFLRDAAKFLDADARESFETGLIHGDWHGGNLMFEGNRLTAIIDLEFAGDGCYLEDLAYAVSNLGIRTGVESSKLERRVNILLDYYQIHRSMSPAEERALYYAVGIKHVATVAYQTHQSDGTVAGLTAVQWMEILAKQCAWLSERAGKIRWYG